MSSYNCEHSMQSKQSPAGIGTHAMALHYNAVLVFYLPGLRDFVNVLLRLTIDVCSPVRHLPSVKYSGGTELDYNKLE